MALVKRHGPTVFGLLLLVAAIYVVQREFRNLHWSDIQGALHSTPAHALWGAAGCTLLAYLVLTAYDRLGSVYAGHPVSYARTSLASFVAYSLANNLGFSTVSGAAIRYRFYAAWGLSPGAIAKVVAFTSLTFGLGGFALGGLVLVAEPEVLPFFGDGTPRWVMQAAGIAMWCVVGSYILLARFVPHFRMFGHQIDLPGFRMAVAQTALASADVAVTALIFWMLLPPVEGLTFLHFLGIYVLALSAGIAANVPGGIGVFDGAVLLGLSGYLAAPVVIGALLLFRLYYYIVPLFLAGLLFAGFEASQRRHVFERISAERGVAISFEVPAMAALAVIAAMALIVIGALPVKPNALDGILDLLDDAANHFAASVVGSLLLVAAYGLMRRLAIAWWVTLVLLLNGAVITALRGEPWWLIGLFLMIAGVIGSARGAFYRRARLTAEPLTKEAAAAIAAAALCGLALATVAYQGAYADLSWWGLVLSADAPPSLRFAVGVAGVLLLAAAGWLLRPARPPALAYDAEVRGRLAALGAMAPEIGGADGAVFGEAGRAGFAFVRRDGIWLGLGDPAGEERDRVSAIWRFRDICARAGVDPAFWRVGPELLRVYSDIGLTPFPLASDAGPRFLVCRAERDLDALMPLLPGGADAA
ncbi:lysylphosphatidylglycerol synthetase family protein [Roseomonas sp. JC162]|uniref:Lysylphosphatidylglycerol synthetase family protein n=1 Tax=Neoroseomonas marina TaxID=1232220 RepID=A0A848E881_9PROT|nr:phosphatidylglycerol lysyltransferase domain-containing protein [Neoroseomonas marina]NMJ40286.1 lysylphosphatidylglycerol synthetase family protein [Neoroseomonas marina]